MQNSKFGAPQPEFFEYRRIPRVETYLATTIVPANFYAAWKKNKSVFWGPDMGRIGADGAG